MMGFSCRWSWTGIHAELSKEPLRKWSVGKLKINGRLKLRWLERGMACEDQGRNWLRMVPIGGLWY
jgi:hypothetical protein